MNEIWFHCKDSLFYFIGRQTFERWRPAIECCLYVGQIDFIEQPFHRIMMNRDVVMILKSAGFPVGSFCAEMLNILSKMSTSKMVLFAMTLFLDFYGENKSKPKNDYMQIKRYIRLHVAGSILQVSRSQAKADL